MFEPPTLTAYPGPIVALGGSVTLQCSSWHGFDWFYLWDEGGDGHQKLLHAQPQAEGWFQALFTVGPVSPTHRGTYRCYGVFSASPCMWSSSSDLLELLISGEEFTARLWVSRLVGRRLASGGAPGQGELGRWSPGLQDPATQKNLPRRGPEGSAESQILLQI